MYVKFKIAVSLIIILYVSILLCGIAYVHLNVLFCLVQFCALLSVLRTLS